MARPTGSADRALTRFMLRPWQDLTESLDRAVASNPRPALSLIALLLAFVAAWIAYVPAHELLHAAGCVAAGGAVREITISPLYGGRLLALWLPFVTAGGEHAGRLTGFTTGRSDLTYLATDAAPYLATIFGGVPLLRLASRRRSALLAGSAFALALAPFVSLTGDYYEMGSIMVTRATAPFDSPPEPAEPATGIMKLRSDDLPALIGDAVRAPADFARDIPGGLPGACLFATLSFAVGMGLAFATYAAGGLVAGWLVGARADSAQETPGV